VGFLAVTVVALFVIGYYFWELGIPGITQPRLDQAAEEQQVTAVERGYNLYQANCAQCHGKTGLGNQDTESPGIGPALNRQDKLFAHLNQEYLHNVLTAGGRYVCGNADSAMPIWSNEGNPPGPLNYKQIDDLIAFIRASSDDTFRVMDPSLFEPVKDDVTGEEKTFTGWVDPAYTPAPDSTPFPACWTDEFTNPQPSGSGSAAPAPTGEVIEESAEALAFVNQDLSAPADEAFTIAFDNKDTAPHNIAISDSSGASVLQGDIVPAGQSTMYAVPALAAGTYPFICSVHPSMTGTLTVGG
jgi:mono/diheme cytochrome c family protein/plastocyanin